MTAYDNPILALLAFAALAAAIFVVLRYLKQISIMAAILVGGGVVLFGGLYIIAVIAGEIYERYTAAQCLTAHERYAHAAAAPNDYWGQQLRDKAAEEAKTCADLAARKEAARLPQKR